MKLASAIAGTSTVLRKGIFLAFACFAQVFFAQPSEADKLALAMTAMTAMAGQVADLVADLVAEKNIAQAAVFEFGGEDLRAGGSAGGAAGAFD